MAKRDCIVRGEQISMLFFFFFSLSIGNVKFRVEQALPEKQCLVLNMQVILVVIFVITWYCIKLSYSK